MDVPRLLHLRSGARYIQLPRLPCPMFMMRRFLLVGAFTALVSGLCAQPVTVILETDLGSIEVEVMVEQAPISGGSFLAHVDAGMIDGGGFYRTVYPENDNGNPKISVIQGGLLPEMEGLPPVAHETTEQTGILHRNGVISLARSEVGSGSGGTFFICIGDQPALDMGGGRAVSGDGQGFAAFGRVTHGMNVVRNIHQTKTSSASEDAYTAGQIIAPPVRISKAYRKEVTPPSPQNQSAFHGGHVPAHTSQGKPKLKDAKTQFTGNPPPPEDPDLENYGIYQDEAPTATITHPIATNLPLRLKRNDRIAFVGNTLLDRAQLFGHFETHLHLAHPNDNLVIRNLAWSADEVDLQPRPANFATVEQHLTREKIDVIFAAFGYNESFAGMEAVDTFKDRLARALLELKAKTYNGTHAPRVVLISPIANENTAKVPAADLNNSRLAAYTAAMAEVAARLQVGFANVFDATATAMADPAHDLTINGAHLTEGGYKIFADALFTATFEQPAPTTNEELRAVVVDKNTQYFRRYRPLNTYYYTGARNKSYGYLDFLPAMRNLEIMTANRDERIWQIAQGRTFGDQPIDDSNVPELDPVKESRGANEWLSPADELASFRIDPRFEVNLFASEEEFPEIACPITMRWDAKGRLWVSCSVTYPHVYPGQKPRDKIVILEDTDNDGKADKSTVWADDIHIPLSYEFYQDGIIVSEEPHLSYIYDSDGDGRADSREYLYTGFGCEDSHHALHDFVWTPDGDLLFRESIFHNSQVETPYGPIRAKNSAWFKYSPLNQSLITFGSYPNTNPWGVTYSDWGHHVASHPIFASAFHATNPAYPEQHPRASGIPAYSGVCGHEFIDFPMWPEDLREGFIKVRYKPTNRVEIHRWIENDDHFAEEYVSDLIFSENLSFIPVDIKHGPRGALYICDWYNPVKGHAQYSLRDPRRDRKSGRIWRIVPKGAELQEPPQIAGASLEQLLENLKRREYRYRYWTKRELRDAHAAADVAAALDEWVAQLDPNADRFRHHQVEAMWVYRSIGESRPELLTELLNSENHHARAAATRQLRYTLGASGMPPMPNLAHNGLFMQQALQLLQQSARDENGIVRLEAATTASYLGGSPAVKVLLDILDRPMQEHLRFAVRSAIGSEAIRPHWEGDNQSVSDADAKRLADFWENWDKANTKADALLKGSASSSGFDRQKDLFSIEISTIPERMLFDIEKFTVRAGQPVRLIFTNPDATQHNLVIIEPGKNESIGVAANEMAKDPSGVEKHFIPDVPGILHATKLIGPDQTEVLRFNAPEKPGIYPYICTFPGHWFMMKGEMIVE
ncbi:MAG: hypothetical protein SynsKO_41570 [Synoicihabitans sp.]